jgi:hypothetical protein
MALATAPDSLWIPRRASNFRANRTSAAPGISHAIVVAEFRWTFDDLGHWRRNEIAVRQSIHIPETMMALKFTVRGALLAMLGAIALVLAGCISAPGTYPDPNGPRNGMGLLVDPLTGVVLPGQSQGGGGSH